MTSEFTDEKKHDKNDQSFHAGFTHNPLPLLVQGDMWDSRLDSPWILLTKLQLHTTSKLTARNKASSGSDRCFRMRARETTFDLWPCVYLPHPETNFSPVEKNSAWANLCVCSSLSLVQSLFTSQLLNDSLTSAAQLLLPDWLHLTSPCHPEKRRFSRDWLGSRKQRLNALVSLKAKQWARRQH